MMSSEEDKWMTDPSSGIQQWTILFTIDTCVRYFAAMVSSTKRPSPLSVCLANSVVASCALLSRSHLLHYSSTLLRVLTDSYGVGQRFLLLLLLCIISWIWYSSTTTVCSEWIDVSWLSLYVTSSWMSVLSQTLPFYDAIDISVLTVTVRCAAS